MDEKYVEKRRNQERQYLRLRLGILQFLHIPVLNLLWIPIIVVICVVYGKKDMVLSLIDIPDFIFPIYRYAIMILAVLIPIVCILALTDFIGEMTARKDEARLYVAFSAQELRNGCPILMDKKYIKNKDVIMREFYSNIPMQIWIERQEAIQDALNCHFVENLCYGGKANGKIIVMMTAKGRKPASRGDLYDDEF